MTESLMFMRTVEISLRQFINIRSEARGNLAPLLFYLSSILKTPGILKDFTANTFSLFRGTRDERHISKYSGEVVVYGAGILTLGTRVRVLSRAFIGCEISATFLCECDNV